MPAQRPGSVSRPSARNGKISPLPEPTGRDGADLRRLGQALGARIDDVLVLTDARNVQATGESGKDLDEVVQDSFERIGRRSTEAVAEWMAGGDPKAGKDTGREAWDTYGQLAAGGGFELVNDHDPKPLYYQFEAEHPGQFTWEYLEQGPEVWRVRISRDA